VVSAGWEELAAGRRQAGALHAAQCVHNQQTIGKGSGYHRQGTGTLPQVGS